MKFEHVFYNQALNTHSKLWLSVACEHCRIILDRFSKLHCRSRAIDVYADVQLRCESVRASDIFVTDPPYADAVNYHEITEFFIAWLRKNPPPPFDQWTWDSRRDLAIKGKDEALPPRHGGRLCRHDPPHARQRPAGGDVHPSGRRRLGRSRRDPLGRRPSRHRRLEHRHRDRKRAEGGQLRPGHRLPRAAQAPRRSQCAPHGDRGRDRGGGARTARSPRRARRSLDRARRFTPTAT